MFLLIYLFNLFFFFEEETATSILHYLSTFSGPLLACIGGTFLCLVPLQNVLEQPSLWYEYQLCTTFAVLAMLLQNLLAAEYWSDFTFENRSKSYMILGGLGFVLYAGVIFGCFLVWTLYYGYVPPMPMSQRYAGGLSIVTTNVALFWFH